MYLSVYKLDVTVFFFQAEDGIRDLVRSRGLGDVYKRQRSVRSTEYLSSADSPPSASAEVTRLPPRLSLKALSLIHI